MSLASTIQEWMNDVGSRERSVVTARTHVAAEVSTEVERICATISQDPFFALPARTWEGNVLGPGSVLTGFDAVEGYYSQRADTYVVIKSLQMKSASTDWFVFNESAATLRGTGEIGGVDVAGREFVVHSATLFPTADDGIAGEICITHIPFADIVSDTVQAPPPATGAQAYFPLREMQHAAMLDRFIAALRSGDAAGVAAELTANHTLAVRHGDAAAPGGPVVHTARDGAEAAAVFTTLVAGADDITLLTRITTDWYVFVEYLIRLTGGGVRRFALLQSIQDGRLSGTYGYGI